MDEPTPECLTHNSYTVGWICALDVELAASVAILDHELPKLAQVQGDTNTYVLGRIGRHNIVLTCLPAGTTGTNAAANTATNMLRTFPNMRFCLMVGIGGGAPSVPSDDPRGDIRLGDVVVSCPSANSGGVLQYDFGKTMSEGKFVQTGVLNKTSMVLSNSVSSLRAYHRIEGSDIPKYICRMFDLKRNLQKDFSHPGPEHDQLFRAEYEHPSGAPTCRSCNSEALVLRKPRENTNPVIHYGLIGSANQVMKHGVTRDKLHNEMNIICFEMEAAGLMDVLSCLVIRGICDYADSHKNKRWQPYAAVTAAACAKEVLLATPASEVTAKPFFNGEAIYNMLQTTLYEFSWKQLVTLLPPLNSRVHEPLNRARDYEAPKFHWVLRNIDFKQWNLSESSRVLCLTGLPSENLDQLSSYIVNLKKAAGYSILSVYCLGMKDKLTPATSTFLLIFLHNLLFCSPEEQRTSIFRTFFSKLLGKPMVGGYPDWEEERFDQRTFMKYMRITLRSATIKDLLTCLKDALDLQMQRRLLVVIDGLHVVESVDERLGCVLPLINHVQRNPNAKILLTSSSIDTTTDLFHDYLHIDYDKERKECLQSLHTENTRYDKISQQHEGSFEWIWTHIEYESWSASDTSKLLYVQGKPGSGKSTLTKYFSRHLWQKQPAAREAIVARFFYSFREGELQRTHHSMLSSIIYDILQQEETFFYHQCQTEYRAQPRHGPHFKWDYVSLKKLLKSLHNYRTNKQFYLIIDAVDESEEKDRREILGLLFELCSGMEHSFIKIFMASRPIAQLEARRDQFHNFIRLEDETRLDIYKYAQSQLYGLDLTILLAQATEYILENAQGVFLWVKLIHEQLIEAHEQGYSEEQIFELLKQLPTELENFYDFMLEKMKQNKSSILYATKMFLFILFAKRPITVDELLHALGISNNVGTDARFIPSDTSFEKCIPSSERVILSSGGNFLEIKKQNGNKIVQIMHQTVREFFLNPCGPVAKSIFWIPETHAHITIAVSCFRYLSVCATNTSLVEKLPKANSWDTVHYKFYCQYLNRRPLASYALRYINSHIGVCKQDASVEYAASQLIEHLTNSNPGASLLNRWANYGLCRGSWSKINVQDAAAMEFRSEILRYASIYGFAVAAELVLLVDTCTDNKDKTGQTPLSLAARYGHEAIVKLLLDKGANIDISDVNGQTPLSWAALNGHRDIVIRLSEYGAYGAKADIYNRTPLSLAAEHNHLAIVKFLFEKGDIVESKDWSGRTPLSWAAEHGHLAIVKFLIEKGASIEPEHTAKTPLSWASEHGHLAVVEFLAEKGASIEKRDRFERTPLSWAAEHGHLPIAKFLVDKGVSVERSDRFNKTPLSWAAEYGHLEIVRFLIENGADIENRDGFHKTPLLLAVENNHFEIVKFLGGKGAITEIIDDFGKTPVSKAIENKRLDVVKFLVEMC